MKDFDRVLRTDLVDGFWKGIRADDPKLIYLLKENPEISRDDLGKCVPLFLHGDKVEFVNDDSLMVWHIGSVLASRTSMYSGLLLGVSPAKIEVMEDGGTWNPVWEGRWAPSFRAMLYGKTVDGTEIHNSGWRFCIWLLIGDHEHFANALKLPRWNNPEYCWNCAVRKSAANPLAGRKFPEGTSGFPMRPIESEAGERIGKHIVFNIHGVTSHNVCHDALHVLYVNGIGNHALGSALYDLCWRSGPGRPKEKLAAIWERAQALYTESGCLSRLTNLRLNMFLDPDRPRQQHPMLKAKGAECKHFIPVMATISAEISVGVPARDEHRTGALKSLSDFGELLDNCGMVPPK